MNIYFSGIGGAGLAPLAMLAQDCDFQVSGSDAEESLQTNVLRKRSIPFCIGQSYEEINQAHSTNPIDWIVITSALPPDHPHIRFAQEYNITISKRHELLNYIIDEKNLKLIGVAGSHGKTTTTTMIVWICKSLNIPISFSIGSNIGFGYAAEYDPKSSFFVYEADEYDRNFLNFRPFISIITSIDYDHQDTYPTQSEYFRAFSNYMRKSILTIAYNTDLSLLYTEKNNSTVELLENKDYNQDKREGGFRNDSIVILDFIKTLENSPIKLPGDHVKRNGELAVMAVNHILNHEKLNCPSSIEVLNNSSDITTQLYSKLNQFPGVQRRFEKIEERIYSDYAHHPSEIEATLQQSFEIVEQNSFSGIICIYQPHQNLRQTDPFIQQGYSNCFVKADKVFWVPTYLSREPKGVSILSPEDLIRRGGGTQKDDTLFLIGKTEVIISNLDDYLVSTLHLLWKNQYCLVFMGAGSIDGWLRNNTSNIVNQ